MRKSEKMRVERIRVKAYFIWLATGNPDSVANWLLAEKYVKGEIK